MTNNIYLVLNNNKADPRSSVSEANKLESRNSDLFHVHKRTIGFSNLFRFLPPVPEEKRNEIGYKDHRKLRTNAGIKDISRHYKHVQGRIVLSKHGPANAMSQGINDALSRDTVLDVESSPTGATRASSAISQENEEDSEDFESQKRTLSHYVKTTDYEQSRIRELKVTIEYSLSARFEDLLICKCISVFLGQISQDGFAWVEKQAAKDYFVCELRAPQFKSFVWYLTFYDDPPLEVDTRHWDLETSRYMCTVLLFSILFPLVIPGVFLRCCYESWNCYWSIWGLRFSVYSLMWKILLVIICPFMLFIWVIGTLLLAFLLIIIRTAFLPFDIWSGWCFMFEDHQWAQWISSIHYRAYYIRALYDDCFHQT